MKDASNRKYSRSHHWETKASIVKFIQAQQPELARKTSYIYIGAYITNAFLCPKLDPETDEFASFLPNGKETMFPISNVPSLYRAICQSIGGRWTARYKAPCIWRLSLCGTGHNNLDQHSWNKKIKLVELTMQAMSDKIGVPPEILEGAAYAIWSGITPVI